MTLIQFTVPWFFLSLIDYCDVFVPILQSDFVGAMFEEFRNVFL